MQPEALDTWTQNERESVKAFGAFLLAEHLEALAAENLRLARAFEMPLLRQFEHLDEPTLMAMTRQGLETFLATLAQPDALEVNREHLRRWERGEDPQLAALSIDPTDLVLVPAAQRRALYAFLPAFGAAGGDAFGVLNALDHYYTLTAKDAAAVFERLQDAAREREAAVARAEVLQALNEELQSQQEELQLQQEELQSQQEELQALYAEQQAANEELAENQSMLEAMNARLRAKKAALEAQNDRIEAEVRKRTAELSRALAQLGTAQRLARLGSWYWTKDEETYTWSPGLYALLGLPASGELLGTQQMAALLHPDDLPAVQAAYERFSETGEPYEITMRMRHADGSYVHVRAIAEGVFEDGVMTGAIGACLDETERLQAEAELRAQSAQISAQVEALRRSDRYKDEFLSVISHELRTPLNFIMGFASLLDDEVMGPLNDEQRRCVGQILSGSDRMLALVQDLLDTAQLQAGKVTLERENLPLDAFLAQALESLAPIASDREVALRLEAPRSACAWIDPTRLNQVVTNLVENAIKFSPPGASVTVELGVGPDRATVGVRDEGPGIPEAERERIFERFQQVDMSATRESGGVGLGLSIAKALVEAHGGSLRVEAALPTGSRFVFDLPAVEA